MNQGINDLDNDPAEVKYPGLPTSQLEVKKPLGPLDERRNVVKYPQASPVAFVSTLLGFILCF